MDKVGTFEYEIRKDFRNNQIVREVDERRLRDLWQSLGIGVVLVVVLLLLRSAARLSAVVFRDGLLGGRLALGYGQMLCYALFWIFLQGSYSPMGR